MLIHAKCTGTVLATLPNAVKLLAEIGADSNCIKLNTIRLHIFKDADTEEEFGFYCTSCHTEISRSEVQGQCRHCGEFFPISDLKIPNETGGTYCPVDIKRFANERHFNLAVILSKPLNIT
jgi:hypothetical protein